MSALKKGFPLKRLWTALLCAALAVLSPAEASANSGPVRMQASPSFAVTPLSDCPVAVTGEDLSFDFSSQERSDYSPLAKASARYEMKNPSSGALNVQMAFPMIASLSDLSRMQGIGIRSDGKDLPFRFSIGEEQSVDSRPRAYFSDDGTLDSAVLPSFGEILKSASKPSGTPEALKGQGTLYRFSCAGLVRLKVGLKEMGQNAAVLTTGVNGYSRTDSGILLDGMCEPGAGMSVLAVGDVSRPDVKTYTENGEKELDAEVRTTATEQDAASFLREKLKNTEAYRAYPTEEFLSELTAAALRAAGDIAKQGIAFGDGELYDFLAKQRILLLTYEVPFPAGGARQVSVQYPVSGEMNAEKTASPVYSYGYLLDPAKNWARFQNLSVRVVPPKEAPYVVRSSLPMTRSQDGSYTAKFNSLPDGDLTFSLYPSEKLTPKNGGYHTGRHVLFRAFTLAAVCLLSFLYFRFFRRRKRKT
ncbi:hypothetical protein EQM14_01190 [Caproiciproducens sp. NJN-50]|uniref:hypothetical protein n=1 Tax=Caproiciproducens sp. NJN-50 TaxID=2507162 RepID=UPI000FFE1B51|nr:hypothetical protein [Caproiciproducens sp. NJN-50]QAT48501.1 hypothetical protein EQM14_01190 [Caproiciproducens sp. NJN-50]